MLSADFNEKIANGKCRKCKYVREYDFTSDDFCAAPCENCGAESYEIKLVK